MQHCDRKVAIYGNIIINVQVIMVCGNCVCITTYIITTYGTYDYTLLQDGEKGDCGLKEIKWSKSWLGGRHWKPLPKKDENVSPLNCPCSCCPGRWKCQKQQKEPLYIQPLIVPCGFPAFEASSKWLNRNKLAGTEALVACIYTYLWGMVLEGGGKNPHLLVLNSKPVDG